MGERPKLQPQKLGDSQSVPRLLGKRVIFAVPQVPTTTTTTRFKWIEIGPGKCADSTGLSVRGVASSLTTQTSTTTARALASVWVGDTKNTEHQPNMEGSPVLTRPFVDSGLQNLVDCQSEGFPLKPHFLINQEFMNPWSETKTSSRALPFLLILEGVCLQQLPNKRSLFLTAIGLVKW